MKTVLACLNMAMLLAAGFANAATSQATRRIGDLKVGDKASDFTLKTLGSKKKFTLSSNFGKKPTVLIFGSYT